MKPIVFKHPRYTRMGECIRCGYCCLKDGCKHLAMNGDKATCGIYEDRPDRCKLFPQMPPVIHDECGYYFFDTWENKIVKRQV